MTTETENTENTAKSDNVLVSAAKALGKAAGAVASTVVHHEPQTSATATPAPAAAKPETKSGKLPKKLKSRLPRREKKARAKARNAA